MNISLTAIAGALLLFLIGMVFTRNFQSWLSDRFLPTIFSSILALLKAPRDCSREPRRIR